MHLSVSHSVPNIYITLFYLNLFLERTKISKRLLSSGGCRDVIGDCGVIGDSRWAGTYGVNADFVALEVL